ncbi:ATP-binding protein [Paenibacillus sp. JDR-2]|uniref:ATP-binding protein n=1 Tax=Paenibacillus sp. (strain JDR-2) TaxID=324057 RepID=UPI0001AAF881|nr:ATP-binding protein [Paenibacillus sp. JDR-2]ACT00498.1 protein of unknown function DUF87 [Paenibacillus sp. JDR-2]
MDKLDIRQEEQLMQSFDLADHIVMKKYLAELTDYEVVPMDELKLTQAIGESARLFKLDKIVYDQKEIVLDKLTTVYNALAGSKGSLVVVIKSDGANADFYIGTKTDFNPATLAASQNTLEKAFKGNFSGSELKKLKNQHVEDVMDSIFHSSYESSMNPVSAVSGVASLRNQDKNYFVQGIEKLLDAMRGEKFSLVYIADPVSHNQMDEIRSGYENLYTQLSPFAASDLQFSANENTMVTEGLTSGFSETVTESLSKTNATTENNNRTSNQSINRGRNLISTLFTKVVGGKNSTSSNEGLTTGYSSSRTEAETYGNSKMNSSQESTSKAISDGTGRSLQLKMTNKAVQSLLERINDQLLRLKKSEDLGLWNCAAYFVAEDVQTVKIAANTYKSLMRGDNSAVESGVVNTWDNKNKNSLIQVSNYIGKLVHPLINLGSKYAEYAQQVTPGTLANGHELAIQAGLPMKSIAGLPVIETAEFGRNVSVYQAQTTKRSITLGNIFHMGAVEPTSVELDVDSLAMHTFVTGSTGSGKSNTIYQLLDKLNQHDVRFLIIEPAKGEYKHVFGGRPNVNVLGTNPLVSDLLKINPFAFPEGIHVLEHIDRLIEIFNACWPMYAAMPAVLKEAIETAYERAGWDMEDSINYSGHNVYPTFAKLLEVLPETIRSSEYSQEVKSNYTGALVTRVKSMTNGINGRIFSSVETEEAVLFDQNCIVDLSRVGSSETKALTMGVLVMRLQEYRAVSANGMNSALKHVTVIEEAHNLLRRTSLEQSQEGSNLQGKAVEMLANAIAEMRTYGEGFIIADQSPNLLDMSVIRNTNTKLILRLPDASDRMLVGQAANLDDKQISELAKLQVGVSAIYQNNWLQPVLCLTDPFKDIQPYVFTPPVVSQKQEDRRMMGQLTQLLLAARTDNKPEREDRLEIDPLLSWLTKQPIPSTVTATIELQLQQLIQQGSMNVWREEEFHSLSKMVSDLYNGSSIMASAKKAADMPAWNEEILRSIRYISELSQIQAVEQAVIQCLLRENAAEDEEAKQFYFLWVEDVRERTIV